MAPRRGGHRSDGRLFLKGRAASFEHSLAFATQPNRQRVPALPSLRDRAAMANQYAPGAPAQYPMPAQTVMYVTQTPFSVPGQASFATPITSAAAPAVSVMHAVVPQYVSASPASNGATASPMQVHAAAADGTVSMVGPPYPRPKGRGKKNCRWDDNHGQWVAMAGDSVAGGTDEASAPGVKPDKKQVSVLRTEHWFIAR